MNYDVISTPTFERAVKQLMKKYPSIKKDIDKLVEQLEIGIFPSDIIKSTGNLVKKCRLRNSDSAVGTSGGYRVIYYLTPK